MEGEKERRGGAEYLTTNFRTFDILCHSQKNQKVKSSHIQMFRASNNHVRAKKKTRRTNHENRSPNTKNAKNTEKQTQFKNKSNNT